MIKPAYKTLTAALCGFTAICFAGTLSAGETATEPVAKEVIVEEEPWQFCDIFDLTTLYSNKENPIIQKFAIVGRFQIDYSYFDADQGQWNDWTIRRARLGFKTQFLQDFTLHVEADWDLQDTDLSDFDDVYNKLTDAYLAWSPDKAFKLKLGKHSAGFTLDGMSSSKKLLTTERNNLTNNLWFTKEYFTGISGSGQINNWVYHLGAYSSENNDEFAQFDAGFFGLATVGYNFAEAMGVDQSLVTLNYVYNQPDEKNGTRDLEHVLSLSYQLEAGQFGLRTDLGAGKGYDGQSDLWGFVAMPFYNINDKFQLVGRYTYLSSEDDNGLRLNKYEDRIAHGRGDRYNEIFGGVNWFICGHKLKLQTGFQYTWMDDGANDGGKYAGWGWSTGLRIYW